VKLLRRGVTQSKEKGLLYDQGMSHFELGSRALLSPLDGKEQLDCASRIFSQIGAHREMSAVYAMTTHRYREDLRWTEKRL
jgi:hypothetical protein